MIEINHSYRKLWLKIHANEIGPSVFYHIENQSKIIVVYISMEKTDQAQIYTQSSNHRNFWVTGF